MGLWFRNRWFLLEGIILKNYFKISLLLLFLMHLSLQSSTYSSSIFVPRQLSYNPILENSLTFDDRKTENDCGYYLSAKPIYTQNVGNKFRRYFSIGHKDVMLVREDGSGDIDPLWFQDISSNSTYYSSDLSFHPIRRTYGSLFFAELKLPHDLYLSFNTALVTASNDVQIQETNSQSLGTANYLTVTQSFASSARLYGKSGKKNKTGLDDLQIKLGKTIFNRETASFGLYALLGVPTNKRSKSIYIFEPLVGSKHVQLGLGANYFKELYSCNSGGEINFLSELKYRYGFGATETRIFDLTANGEWSRYLLLVSENARYDTFFATNNLALPTHVAPCSSLDIYLALHSNYNNWQFELGYDFWYRSAERVQLKDPANFTQGLGVADLVGIAALNPQSASKANISESVVSNGNQIPSDSLFVSLTSSDLNLHSAAAPRSISNSAYLSMAYNGHYRDHSSQVGLNFAYERGTNVNVPDNISMWINFNLNF